MSNLKIELIKEAISRQMGNLIALNYTIIPLEFMLNNIPRDGELNVFEVESKEEANQIISYFDTKGYFIDKVFDYDKPLYLTVNVTFPL